ncbi:Uncharacterised protein [Pseudomonas luteola]|uniref:Secreted protein n=1 Tax=Pseudomonas luteola TaxID=47886 RepID=A0A2X2BWK2_PSELU|nr:Uncharacterised protein [Pseudomonas luteola]
MYSIGHLLKAAPLTLAIAWAAPALALNPNSAEIGINSSIKSMNVTINRGGSGCAPGQQWDTTAGGCSGAQVVGSDSTTQVQTTNACPAGQAGTVNQQRSCTRNQYGWRLPNGTTATDHYDDWACSDWTTTSSSCVASTPVITFPPESQKKGWIEAWDASCALTVEWTATLLTWSAAGATSDTTYTLTVVDDNFGARTLFSNQKGITQTYLNNKNIPYYNGDDTTVPEGYWHGTATLKACNGSSCSSASVPYTSDGRSGTKEYFLWASSSGCG